MKILAFESARKSGSLPVINSIPAGRSSRPGPSGGAQKLDESAKRDDFGCMHSSETAARRLKYLLAAGFLVRLVLAWLPDNLLPRLLYDDAYYYFAIAKNLAASGIFSADGITQTNGFHPLWLFLITPFYLLFPGGLHLNLHLAMTLSALFDTAAGFLIFKTFERLEKPKTGFWAAAFYLFNPYSIFITMRGLETGLNSFLLAALLYFSFRATREWLKSGWLLLGSTCGLAMLARTDNVFAVGALLSYFVIPNKGMCSLVKASAIAAAIVVPWLVYNQIEFGSIVQTSAGAYPAFHYHQLYLNEHQTYFSFAVVPYVLKSVFYNIAYNAHHYGNWVLTLFVAGILLFQILRHPEKFRPFYWALAGAGVFVFIHACIFWLFRPWYAPAVFVLTLPLVVLAFENARRWLVISGAVLGVILSGWFIYQTPFYGVIDRLEIARDVIEQKIPAADRVGSFNSGYVQYFTNRKVINLDGLVNNEVWPYYKKQKALEYLRQREIRWIVDFPDFPAVIFAPYFELGAESSLALVDLLPDPQNPQNNIAVIAVLPEGQRPPPGREVPMYRSTALKRQWGRVPWL